MLTVKPTPSVTSFVIPMEWNEMEWKGSRLLPVARVPIHYRAFLSIVADRFMCVRTYIRLL